MRALLLDHLKAFKKVHPHVEITYPKFIGNIEEIIDDELLKFKEKTQTDFTYIPIDKIMWVRGTK